MEPVVFVVSPALAGILGNAGQGNYAGRQRIHGHTCSAVRRRAGLPGCVDGVGSVTRTRPDRKPVQHHVRRLAGSGMPPLSVQQGMRLFDRAVASNGRWIGMARLDLQASRPARGPGHDPDSGRRSSRRVVGEHQQHPTVSDSGWRVCRAEEREPFLMDLVLRSRRRRVGHPSSGADTVDQAFRGVRV